MPFVFWLLEQLKTEIKSSPIYQQLEVLLDIIFHILCPALFLLSNSSNITTPLSNGAHKEAREDPQLGHGVRRVENEEKHGILQATTYVAEKTRVHRCLPR